MKIKRFITLFAILASALAGSIDFSSIYLDFTNSNLMRNIAMTFTLESNLPTDLMMRVVSPIQLHSDDLLTMPQFIITERDTLCQTRSIQEYLQSDFLSFGWQAS